MLVGVVSHDAGGAEILSSWVNRTHHPTLLAATGPAEVIFRRKCPEKEIFPLDHVIEKSSWILTGTGWQSDFERLAIKNARKVKKKSVAFLDHWTNYRERFIDAGEMSLPDEIWVGDYYAEKIARRQFNTVPIVLKKNPYFQDINDEISKFEIRSQSLLFKRVLYVCEPMADHALKDFGNERHFGYSEHDALRYFLDNVKTIKEKISIIKIRKHPSEQLGKYDWAKLYTSYPIEFSSKQTLLEEISDSDIVVGCESMAMVVGLMARKRVISSIPEGGRACQLPHMNIEKMEDFVRLSVVDA